jgi:hypothetical protein
MTDLLEPWYAALQSPLGVIVHVDEGEFDRARAKLYAARKESADPGLEQISICQSPTSPTDLWLVKRKPNGSTK